MEDALKTKAQLLDELREVRTRLSAAEDAQSACVLAEEAVRESESKFRSVARSAVDAIISTDSNDRIVFWNKAAQRIFGYSEEEALGKPAAILIPPQYRDLHTRGMKRYLETGKPVLIGNTVQLEGLRRDGTQFPLELSLATWRTRAGVFFTGIIRDITTRRDAEQALQQRTEESHRRSEELESLVQTVAHDLKSPVMSIAGLVGVLRKRLSRNVSDEPSEQILAQVETASKAMEHFLWELLDGLAIENTPPRPEPVELGDTIREVAALHARTAEEKGIRLVLEIEDVLPNILGDAHRIRQVVDNLVVNAIRHMGRRSDPTIRVRVVVNGAHVVTSVSDNGVGIPVEFRGKVFDRFFRVPRADHTLGTGLGLSIVKSIVEGHGGRITLESEEGVGTTFSFSLPVGQSDAHDQPQ
ncbi:MAG: PAS domain S-box protein [Thermodesulfobacteriota bacterium]